MGTIWSVRNFTNSKGKDEIVYIRNKYCQNFKFEVRCYSLGLISNRKGVFIQNGKVIIQSADTPVMASVCGLAFCMG